MKLVATSSCAGIGVDGSTELALEQLVATSSCAGIDVTVRPNLPWNKSNGTYPTSGIGVPAPTELALEQAVAALVLRRER